MKKIIFAFAILLAFQSEAQISTDTIDSHKLKERRIISISLPPSYKKQKDKKFPILVLLDGDYLFNPVNGALDYGYFWDDLPEVIVVGIHQNKNNEREADCETNTSTGFPEEKGVQFFDFIGMELMPILEKQYRVAPMKIIAGHDLTAGFMNLFLLKSEPLFNAYLSFSPELGPNMENLLAERLSTINKPFFYYQSMSEGDLDASKKQVADFDANLKKIENKNLYYKYDEFKNTSHYSMVLFSIPSALYHLFGVFQPISTKEYNEKIYPLKSNFVDYLTDKYNIIEKTYNMKIKVRINDMKAIETIILKNKAYLELGQLADLAKKNYPKSLLSDYYLAMMYENLGEAKKAAKCYMDGYQKESIGDLTKDMMFEKANSIKSSLPKKGDPIKETPLKETPIEEPVKEKQ
jgi:predicted alpha/beta superfamily hydrolase